MDIFTIHWPILLPLELLILYLTASPLSIKNLRLRTFKSLSDCYSEIEKVLFVFNRSFIIVTSLFGIEKTGKFP